MDILKSFRLERENLFSLIISFIKRVYKFIYLEYLSLLKYTFSKKNPEISGQKYEFAISLFEKLFY